MTSSTAKLTKPELRKLEAYYAFHIRNVERHLPVKARVVMTDEALAMFPRYRGKRGTIVGHKYSSPVVLWDGRRTTDSYAPWFIRRVGRALPTSEDRE